MDYIVNAYYLIKDYLILLLVVVLFLKPFKNFIIKIIDMTFTIKNLKVSLFIVLIFILFLILNSFYKIICLDNELIAPYMIASSALLASIIATINIINTNIRDVVDKSNEVIAITHSGIAKINFFTEKSKLLKLMLIGESNIVKDLLNEYDFMLRDILVFLNNKDLHKYIDGEKHKSIYFLHNEIILLLPIIQKAINHIKSTNTDNSKISILKSSKQFDSLIKSFEDFQNDLIDIRNEKTKERQKFYEQQ